MKKALSHRNGSVCSCHCDTHKKMKKEEEEEEKEGDFWNGYANNRNKRKIKIHSQIVLLENVCKILEERGHFGEQKLENGSLVLRPEIFTFFLWMKCYPNEMPASILFIIRF